jgi:hypothetical protein
VPAKEPEALVDDVEDARRVRMAGALRLALQDPLDEIVLAFLGSGLELEIAADGTKLRDAHLAEVGDLEVIPLAGGFDLELLVVFADGRALDLAATPGTTVSRTLVWTELGHGREIPSGRRREPRPGWNRAESIRCAGRSGMQESYAAPPRPSMQIDRNRRIAMPVTGSAADLGADEAPSRPSG